MACLLLQFSAEAERRESREMGSLIFKGKGKKKKRKRFLPFFERLKWPKAA